MTTFIKRDDIYPRWTDTESCAIDCKCGERFLIIDYDQTKCTCGRVYYCKIKIDIYEIVEEA